MLGKTAGGLFWMSRYMERSENNARLLEAGFRIALTRSATAESEWKSILTTAGSLVRFSERNDAYESSAVINYLLRDAGNPSSIVSVLKQARDNARTVRTALTREVWEAINDSWMLLSNRLKRPVRDADLPDVLVAIRRQNAQVRGAFSGTMLRSDGYNFARLGTFIERADNTARILDVKYFLLLPSVAQIGSTLDNVQWETILRSVSAHGAYRWLYGTRISARNIADFLILHRQLPRSLGFCCDQIRENLGYLQRDYGAETASGRRVDAICNGMLSGTIEHIFDNGLHEFLTQFLSENSLLARQIEIDYSFKG